MMTRTLRALLSTAVVACILLFTTAIVVAQSLPQQAATHIHPPTAAAAASSLPLSHATSRTLLAEPTSTAENIAPPAVVAHPPSTAPIQIAFTATHTLEADANVQTTPAPVSLASTLTVDSPNTVSPAVQANSGANPFAAEAPKRARTRFAWVMMHYEGTSKDDEYLLGLRVLIRSIKDTNTPYDIVVITSSNVRESSKAQLIADGALLNEVANLQNPFESRVSGRNSYKARFVYSLNKLYCWAMTQYERVAYLDSDNIFVNNMDSVFLCGHFCVVYMNPLIFHTGLIVVKPDRKMFEKLITALYSDSSFSHDGADQGFLVSQFDIEHSSLFLPPVLSPASLDGHQSSDEPAQRLNIGWNINHFWYYIAFDWGWFFHTTSPSSAKVYPWVAAYHANDEDDQTVAGSSIAYCSGMMLKPWYWFPTFYFDHHYTWHTVRAKLGIDYSGILISRIAALIPIIVIVKFLTQPQRIDRLTFLDPARTLLFRFFSLAPVQIGYAVGTLCFIVNAVIVFQLIPYVTPPAIAWCVWSVWHIALMYTQLTLLVHFALRLPTHKRNRAILLSGVTAGEEKGEMEEVMATAKVLCGPHGLFLLCLAQTLFFLCWLPVYPHFIVKIVLFECYLLAWIIIQAHTFRRATERMCQIQRLDTR